MLQVELNHILPESDGLQRIKEIIDHVEREKEVYILTKDGRPVVAIINVDQLETEVPLQAAMPAPSFSMAPATAAQAAPQPATDLSNLPPMPMMAEPVPAPVAAPITPPVAFTPPIQPTPPPAPVTQPAPSVASYPAFAPNLGVVADHSTPPPATPVAFAAITPPSSSPSGFGSPLDEPLEVDSSSLPPILAQPTPPPVQPIEPATLQPVEPALLQPTQPGVPDAQITLGSAQSSDGSSF